MYALATTLTCAPLTFHNEYTREAKDEKKSAALVTLGNLRTPGANDEMDLSWFVWSVATSLSRDGKLLIFGESGEASGGNYGVYARKLDGSPAVRLGDGDAGRISNDGRTLVLRNDVPRPHLEVWPLGPGQARVLNTENVIPGDLYAYDHQLVGVRSLHWK
jgi:hypothetical protein